MDIKAFGPDEITLTLGSRWRFIALWTVVAFFTFPAFRSGNREGLSMWEWIVNHTVYGPPVEYVPEESYLKELEGTYLDDQGNLKW